MNRRNRAVVAKGTLRYHETLSFKAVTYVVKLLTVRRARTTSSWPLRDSKPSPWTYYADDGDAYVVIPREEKYASHVENVNDTVRLLGE